jgi:DNA-binding response OmpR family regulator
MKKILLIDDEQYIRDIYVEVLKKAGYEIDISDNGEDGYKKIMEGGYDLILLDVMLPYLDGIEILKKLKAEKPKKENGPMVLLTNLSCDPVLKEAAQYGPVTCQNKAEMNPDQFLEKVKEALKETKD